MYKVRAIEVEADEFIAIMNRADAEDEALQEGDRIKVAGGKHSLTAIVHVTDTLVPKGEVGLLSETRQVLKVKEGSKVGISPT